MSAVESSLEVVRSGSYPPWKMLAKLIHSVDSSSLIDWSNYTFDDNLIDSLNEHGISNTLTDTMDIYNSIRKMMVEAVTLSETSHNPDDPIAQSLAKRWWEMIMGMTNGEDANIQAFAKMNEDRKDWPESDRKLFETAEPFIEAALSVYILSNNIEVPNSLLDKK